MTRRQSHFAGVARRFVWLAPEAVQPRPRSLPQSWRQGAGAEAWRRTVAAARTAASGSGEVGHGVHRPPDPYRIIRAVDGVYDKGLFAAVVEDRDHQIVSVRQRPADLDLAVASLEATVQPEDSARPRRAANRDLRTLAQLSVGRLHARAAGIDTGEEKRRHARGPLRGRAGKRRRSFAVILRILSEPSLTCR